MDWNTAFKIALAKITSLQAFVGLIICFVIYRLTETNTAALAALNSHNDSLMKILQERENRITALLDKLGAEHKKK